MKKVKHNFLPENLKSVKFAVNRNYITGVWRLGNTSYKVLQKVNVNTNLHDIDPNSYWKGEYFD